jgi:hypothetical protein
MLSITRKVRSAGRTSGSIEITLPPEVQLLEGIECRLILRDGARPEIVIQPDISMAEDVFAELWGQLRVAFGQIGEIGPFSLSDFNVSFLPPRHWHEHPPLSYRDALAIHRTNRSEFHVDSSGLSHVITFLTVGAAYRLGLQNRYALVFGVIVGYLVSGMSTDHATDFEQDMALRLFNGPSDAAPISVGSLFNTNQWEEAQAGFERIFKQVWAWQSDPGAYEVARRRWWEHAPIHERE